MVLIGIDIGLTGALSVINPGGWCAVVDLPLRELTTGERVEKRLDGRLLVAILRKAVPVGETAILIAEDVRPRPQGHKADGAEHGNTMHSQGSLMRSRGIVECSCDVARIEPHFIQPQTWKRFYGLLKQKKDMSREKAIALYPSAEPDLKRKKDINRAESLLLAHWALRNLA